MKSSRRTLIAFTVLSLLSSFFLGGCFTPEPPETRDDSFRMLKNSTKSMNVFQNDPIYAGIDDLGLDIVKFPSHGTIEVKDLKDIQYTPENDFVGEDSFIYRLSNELGSSDGTVFITIKNENIAPEVNDEHLFEEESHLGVSVDLFANDLDLDDELEVLTYRIVEYPKQGIAQITGTILGYRPKYDAIGVDTFTYGLSDGIEERFGTVTITLLDRPIVIRDEFYGDPNEVLTLDVGENDIAVGDLEVVSITLESNFIGWIYRENEENEYATGDSFSYSIEGTVLTFSAKEPGWYLFDYSVTNEEGLTSRSFERTIIYIGQTPFSPPSLWERLGNFLQQPPVFINLMGLFLIAVFTYFRKRNQKERGTPE